MHKAILLAKGFTQKLGIDYNEIFSNAVKYKTRRILLSLAIVHDLEIDQLDVKTAFLHGEVDGIIFTKQPK